MISYTWLNRCAVVCLFVFALIAAQANAQEPDITYRGVELINQNPSFEKDFRNWDQYINAEAGATFDINEGEATEGKKCAHINVTKISGTNWHVGLTQDRLTLEGGQMYTADFLAKADVKRIIALEVKRSPGEGPWEGITERDIMITENWEEYSLTFTSGKDYDQTAFLGFWLGQVKGEVWIDGVRLYEGKKQEREAVLPKSVEANGKLITIWAAIKAVH